MICKTFSELIASYFVFRTSILVFVKDNYKNLTENEIKNKARLIRKYVNGSVVPNYVSARDITNKLKIDINERDLLDILEYSKNEKEVDEIYNTYLIKNINIKYNEILIDKGMSYYDKQQLLQNRINKICVNKSGKQAEKEYLIKLIENDLKKENS